MSGQTQVIQETMKTNHLKALWFDGYNQSARTIESKTGFRASFQRNLFDDSFNIIMPTFDEIYTYGYDNHPRQKVDT